jgi:hypothetical protein
MVDPGTVVQFREAEQCTPCRPYLGDWRMGRRRTYRQTRSGRQITLTKQKKNGVLFQVFPASNLNITNILNTEDRDSMRD